MLLCDCVGGDDLTDGFAQHVLADLAGRGAWKFGDEFDAFRTLLWRKPALCHETDEGGKVRVLARTSDDERANALAQPRVRHCDHRCFGHAGVKIKHVLDLLGADILPSTDDQIFFATGNKNCIVRSHDTDIAGAEIALSVHRLAGLVLIGITQEHGGAARDDFAFLSRCDFIVVVIEDADFVIDDLAIGRRGAFGVMRIAERD